MKKLACCSIVACWFGVATAASVEPVTPQASLAASTGPNTAMPSSLGSNVGTMHTGEIPTSAAHVAHRSDFATLAVRFAEQHAVPAIGGSVASTYQSLVANERVIRALDSIKKNDELTLREQIEIAQIPAPPFKEQVRARDFQARLQGLVGVEQVTGPLLEDRR